MGKSLKVVSDVQGETAKPKATKPKAATPRPTKAEREARISHIKLCRCLAGIAGGIAIAMVTLSVVHLCEAIMALTASHWALAALLAVGVDAGMISAELAEILAHGNRDVKLWAYAYMIMSIGLSMLLNAYAFASHAHSSIQLASGIALGIMIPALVFTLGRIAGHLAKSE